MERLFKSDTYKAFLSRSRDYEEILSQPLNQYDLKKQAITSIIGELLKKEALKTMSTIPIEEINRDKIGIRIKTLKDAGYTTIADLEKASTYELTAINGISAQGAALIKIISNKIALEIRKDTKLKLSYDDRNHLTTQLVNEINSYHKYLPMKNEVQDFLDRTHYDQSIRKCLTDMKRVRNTGLWIFSSGAAKTKANEAFEYIRNAFDGEYTDFALKIKEFISEMYRTSSEGWSAFQKDPVSFYNTIEELFPDAVEAEDSFYGLSEELASTISGEEFNLDGLNCHLRKYQDWGVRYILHQKKVLLGDEMGLGKTIQAIAAMVALRNQGKTHFIVVCPASVLSNWCREISRMSDFKPIKVHGADRELALEEWKENGGAAVTNFETTWLFDEIDHRSLGIVVVDEAHYIKNPDAQRTMNTVSICKNADRLLFMTGTALENRVDEMISLIRILNPTIAKDLKFSDQLFAASSFKNKIVPVYYRRKREDVLKELPELTEIDEWCELLPEEEKIYEMAVLRKDFTNARRVSWNVDDLSKSSKALRLFEIIEDAKEDGRKVLVFSFFLDTIHKIKEMLGDQCMEPISGSVPVAKRQEIIDQFDEAEPGTVLVAQIQSGGTGLNIQSASVVVICEPQFKPSIENQAISRAYRMGQARNVFVHRLLCENTVDEKMMKVLNKKQKIFDKFADESVAAKEDMENEITNNSFGNIMNEERKRIREKTA